MFRSIGNFLYNAWVTAHEWIAPCNAVRRRQFVEMIAVMEDILTELVRMRRELQRQGKLPDDPEPDEEQPRPPDPARVEQNRGEREQRRKEE